MIFHRDDIVRIAKHGDKEAFSRMFHEYYGKLFGLARYYVKSNELAEEVVDDTFVKIWQKRKKLSGVKNLEAYLYTIIKNHSLNQIRTNSDRQFMSIDNVDLKIKMIARNPEEQLLSKEMLSVMEHSVSSLPERCGLVYRMVKDDGLSYKEVAAMLKISVKMVEKHVGTALRRIRQEMTGYTGRSNTNLKNLK
ncbi:MAG: RNA polymerase sigma-70 factor [Reichenbachiella sp.]|uniref:RNA polymerase sigma factor n=2 Tax=Reichenbachiella sp. TaxID=2184521 RepID=UPI003267C58D